MAYWLFSGGVFAGGGGTVGGASVGGFFLGLDFLKFVNLLTQNAFHYVIILIFIPGNITNIFCP